MGIPTATVPTQPDIPPVAAPVPTPPPIINKKWTKVIPILNWICLIISLLLLFGLDLMILLSAGTDSSGFLTQDALFQIWIIMLAVFSVYLVLFFLENFSFNKRFATSRSRLDNWIILVVVIRNLLVLGSSTPLIHLLVWFMGWVIAIPLLIIYFLLILKRSKVQPT